MDDFAQMIHLLESAKQLASMNNMPMLAYLIDVAKCEARENKPVLRERKHGLQKTKKPKASSSE
jgi:hypothetical protein